MACRRESFCYVDDLIDGFILFMENSLGEQGPMNMGNPHEITINDIAKLIIQQTQSKSN